MKYFKYIFYGLIFTLLSACVSSQKYQSLKSASNDYQAQNKKLRNDSLQLARDVDYFKSKLREQTGESVEQEVELTYTKAYLDQLQQNFERRKQKWNDLRKYLNRSMYEFEKDGVFVYEDEGKIHLSLPDQLLFPSASAWVSKKGKKALSSLAKVLRENSELDVIVEGHTDNRVLKDAAPYLDNWDLSTSRATAVVRVLTEEYQVNPTKLMAAGRAQYDPYMNNYSSANRQQNRRVEIIFLPDMSEILDRL